MHKRLLNILGLICMVFFLYYCYINIDNIPSIDLNIKNIGVFAFSISLSIIAIFFAGCIFYVNLDGIGFIKAQAVVSISQFGKYLPGNVGQHVGRVLLARDEDISTINIVNALILETVIGIYAATLVSLLALSFFIDIEKFNITALSRYYNYFSGDFKVSIIIVFLVAPILLIYLSYFMPKRILGMKTSCLKLKGFSYRVFYSSIVFYLLCFSLHGAILTLQLESFFGVNSISFFQLTCFFSIAWLLGYITPGSPGGLGVRESILVAFMSPLIGGGNAIAISLLLRLTTTMGDLVAFSIGLAGKKYYLSKG